MAEEASKTTTLQQVVLDDVTTESLKTQPHSENLPENDIIVQKTHVSDYFFKEESTKVSDLPAHENKALHDLKLLVQHALDNDLFSASSKQQKPDTPVVETTKDEEEEDEPTKTEEETDKTEPDQVVVHDNETKTGGTVSSSVSKTEKEDVSIWGIPLLADERSDVILLKFLRARDLKVKEAFTMIKNTIRWRKEFRIEELVNEKNLLGDDDLENVVSMHGFGKVGTQCVITSMENSRTRSSTRRHFQRRKRERSS